MVNYFSYFKFPNLFNLYAWFFILMEDSTLQLFKISFSFFLTVKIQEPFDPAKDLCNQQSLPYLCSTVSDVFEWGY